MGAWLHFSFLLIMHLKCEGGTDENRLNFGGVQVEELLL
jgi:hypothetical protein